MKDVSKIIFDFIEKGKDKIKRSALISDTEDGGLKAPHLDSIIETQRILCCKNWQVINRATDVSLLMFLYTICSRIRTCNNNNNNIYVHCTNSDWSPNITTKLI